MSVLEMFLSVFIAVFAANVAMAALTVFFEHRKPASTWAWIMVITFVPVIGFLCYMVFGRESRKEEIFRKKADSDCAAYCAYMGGTDKYGVMLSAQKKAIEDRIDIIGSRNLDDLAYLNIGAGSCITCGNRVKSFFFGEEKFRSLIEDIERAESSVHMEYYIIKNDNLGREVIDRLTQKAAEGVEVRFLYDAMGSRSLPKDFFDGLVKAGGQVGYFLPPFPVRLNYRNHRKIAVIDGKYAYLGGLNIADEYLGRVDRYGKWRDTHIRIEGDAADMLQLRFIMDWNFVKNNEIKLDEKYFPKKENTDGVKIQIVSGGPDTKQPNIRNACFKMINEAERNIYITTPYFVPDDGIFSALKVAALSGIDVRIIIPANPDHPFVYWASMSYLGELLKAGVRCYQYNDGFIHAKTVYADGFVSAVGTANMDIRSFELNFETDAFIYDRKLTSELEKRFLKDIESCTEITEEWYGARGAAFKFREAVSRLISPML